MFILSQIQTWKVFGEGTKLWIYLQYQCQAGGHIGRKNLGRLEPNS